MRSATGLCLPTQICRERHTHAHTFVTDNESSNVNVATTTTADWTAVAASPHQHTGTTGDASSLPTHYEVVWVMRVK